ncbi:Scavenger receptor class B member 1 [Orchesella cincta]|uniref:Scavenger receptor class B member 1 n=1 Tax=Orchesella cincta TaxID=48709 RepID=A0A1D2N655_ORCCI|nr:Scavenger receptor class B member 1 [Orchesella cincta]
MIRLEPGNDVWNAWSEIKAPIFLHAYIFNITNAEDVLKGETPQLQQLGPYVYEQKRTKEILHVNPENGTVLYKPTLLHFFRPELSNGTEEDPVTMLNIPLLSVASELGSMSSMIRYMARFYLDSFEEQPFVYSKAGTILFKGSHVPMIESISELMGRELLPNNTFAFFIERNGTSPDNFEVDSGMVDSTGFGDIKSWKGKHEMDVWSGPTCNMINGTDTTIYAPFITKQKVIRIFEAEICRSLHMTYDHEVVAQGIPGYKFSPPSNIFGEENPDNQCFCKETDKSKCPKSGVVSIGPCKHEAPIFISNPYFLDADPSYGEPFGMVPNATLHKPYLIVEPRTGVVLEGHKRVQLNTHLKPSEAIDVFANVPDLMVPLVWIDEAAVQEEVQLEKLRNMLVTPLLIVEYGKWSVLAVSCTMTVIGIALFMMKSKNQKVETREAEKFIFM